MKIVIASSNPHKLAEIRAVFDEASEPAPAVQLIGLLDIGCEAEEPVEDQPTFEGNAALKARYYAIATGCPVLADDSGLVVDALGGAPGVHSARYAGVTGPRDVVDTANNQLLLQKLADTPPRHRTARFVCVMALCDPPVAGAAHDANGPAPVITQGQFEGRIIGPNESPRGNHGFGYDPLFYLPDLGKTSAELSPDHKNRISHRGQAARCMRDVIAKRLHANRH